MRQEISCSAEIAGRQNLPDVRASWLYFSWFLHVVSQSLARSGYKSTEPVYFDDDCADTFSRTTILTC